MSLVEAVIREALFNLWDFCVLRGRYLMAPSSDHQQELDRMQIGFEATTRNIEIRRELQALHDRYSQQFVQERQRAMIVNIKGWKL